MAFPVPVSLSPTAIGNFTQCAKLFQFANLERIDQPPSIDMVRGIIVHDALFRIFWNPQPRADLVSLHVCDAIREAMEDPAVRVLGLLPHQWIDEVQPLVGRLWELEDPDSITPIGLELKVEGTFDGTHKIRGIIDRLDLNDDGTYTVTDYKTGKAPSKAHTFDRLRGVGVYAAILEDQLDIEIRSVQLLCLGGKKPTRVEVRLSDTQMAAARRRVNAVWIAVEDGCQAEHFIANPGPLCGWCAFRDRCPTGDAYLTRRGK